MEKIKNNTLAFAANFTGIFFFGISMVIIGSILPLLKVRFGMTDIESGALFSILSAGLLIGSVAFGPVVDKFGYRWVLFTALLFLALGFLGIAHSSSLDLLRLSILFFGVGGGVINGGTSALVSDLSEGRDKIINLNWLGMFYGIGAFVMPLMLSVIGEEYYAKVLNGASMVCLFIAFLFLRISYPVTIKKEKISFALISVFFRNRLFMGICFYLFFQSAFEAIVNNWSVLFFIEKLGENRNNALVALSSSVLGIIGMRLITGSLLKNLHHFVVVRISLVLLLLGLVCLWVPSLFYVHLLGMFLIGGGLAPGFPVMLGVVGELFKGVSGTAFGFAMLVALTGNTVLNYLTGAVIEKLGMEAFPYVILTEIVAMAFIFLFIKSADKGISHEKPESF